MSVKKIIPQILEYVKPADYSSLTFKGKFLAGLKGLHEAGRLSYEGKASKYRNQYEYQELLDICYGKSWVMDIRESFAGAETVMHYLGHYTHRIAISNSRILRMDEDTVTIRVKGYKSGGGWKELTLDGREFLRRFKKNDKVQAIKILYKKDVTVCPYCGGTVSYEACSGRRFRKSSA